MAERDVARAPTQLLHVFASFDAAGAQLRSVALWNAFGSDFEHAVVALDGRVDALSRVANGVIVRCLQPPPIAGSLRTIVRLRRLIGRDRPAAVLTYGFAALDALVAARSLGLCRLAHHEDGFLADEALALKRRRVAYRRLVLPRCERVIVVSAALERFALERWGVARERVVRIDNGVELSRFAPADGNQALRRELGWTRDAIVVGALGQLRAVKRFDRLLRVFSQASPRCVLLLIGDGPERGVLEKLSGDLHLDGRVRFVGAQLDPRPWLAACDIFALTSDSEQMPLALLEAMACMLPVVATQVGEVARMLPPEQQSLLINLDSAALEQRLAQAIDALAGDPTMRAQLGDANRRRAIEHFSFERMAASHRAVFASLARDQPPSV